MIYIEILQNVLECPGKEQCICVLPGVFLFLTEALNSKKPKLHNKPVTKSGLSFLLYFKKPLTI